MSAPNGSLGPRLVPCGPVIDAKHAERTREIVEDDLGAGALDGVWAALAPVLGASPYLSGLSRLELFASVGLVGAQAIALSTTLTRLEELIVQSGRLRNPPTVVATLRARFPFLRQCRVL